MAITYDIGDAPTVTATFRDIAGTLTSPTTVTAKLLAPDGVQTNLTPASSAAGIWSVTVPTFALSGRYRVKFFGTGAITAAEEVSMFVQRSPIV